MANFEHAEDDPKHVKISGDSPAASAPAPPAVVSSAADSAADFVPCSIPSFAAASELLSAPYSCLVMNTHRRHIALPPVYLKKKKSGIKEELETELLKFSQRLNGVPLAYDNVMIVGQHGNIYDDSGYIHMDIEATYIIFKPTMGQKLLGIVNKLGVGHVGCLVHRCFNASIPKPNLVPVETWRDEGPRIGAELEFEVMALDADTAGVLLIRGRLTRTRVQELLAQGESTESGVPVDQTEPTAEPSQESLEDTPKKKKKKKKDKVKEEEVIRSPLCQQESSTTAVFNETKDQADGDEAGKEKKKKKKDKVKEEETVEVIGSMTPAMNGATDEADGDEGGEKKKKKKKEKKKDLKVEEEEINLPHRETQVSDSSGYHSDKSSKKRKQETGSDVKLDFSKDIKPPKSKKKRKSEIEQFS